MMSQPVINPTGKTGAFIIRKSYLSLVDIIIRFILPPFLLLLALNFILIVLGGSFFSTDFAMSIFFMLIFLFLVVTIVLLGINYIRLSTTHYEIIPNSIETMGESKTMKPGNITVVRNFLTRRVNVYNITEFERVVLRQSLLGKMFGYGTVELVAEPNKRTQNILLREIPHPIYFINFLQEMIDNIERSQLMMGGA
jgi:ABC-type multidrug transport system fused ATPase/permease subunit